VTRRLNRLPAMRDSAHSCSPALRTRCGLASLFGRPAFFAGTFRSGAGLSPPVSPQRLYAPMRFDRRGRLARRRPPSSKGQLRACRSRRTGIRRSESRERD